MITFRPDDGDDPEHLEAELVLREGPRHPDFSPFTGDGPNGIVVFDGPNGFPRVPDGDNGEGGASRYWGRMVVTIPSGVLRPGQNTIALRNTEPWTGALNVPYILVNEVRLNY